MRIPVVGQTYESRSVAVDAQRTINFYPERVESGQGKTNLVLYPTPGLKLFCTLPDAPVRALFAELGKVWAVAGSHLYEIISNGTYVERGTVMNDGRPAKLRTNGFQGHQLMVTSGLQGYILDINTNAFYGLNVIAGFPSNEAISCTFIDGYFVVFTPSSFQISGLFNGLTWDAADKAVRSEGADPIVFAFQNHRELWLFGDVTSEIWYNSGAASFPFQPIAGVFIEMGCGSPWSVTRLDNMVAWIAKDRDGDRIAVVSPQYVPQRVSTHAVEMAWRRYSRTDDAVGFAYQMDGHTFWQITFPSAEATWVFDVSTKMWHERAFWDATRGAWEAHRAIAHCFNFDKHLVGDRVTGKVYEWSLRHALDDGALIRRLRRVPHVSHENQWLFFQRLEIELEAGLPPMPPDPPLTQVTDPMVMLRWSDDRGHTWSSEQWRTAGQQGQYMARAYWERLGRSRDRVFEITVSAQIPWRLIDGYLSIAEGLH